jgi:hypothetical protein
MNSNRHNQLYTLRQTESAYLALLQRLLSLEVSLISNQTTASRELLDKARDESTAFHRERSLPSDVLDYRSAVKLPPLPSAFRNEPLSLSLNEAAALSKASMRCHRQVGDSSAPSPGGKIGSGKVVRKARDLRSSC